MKKRANKTPKPSILNPKHGAGSSADASSTTSAAADDDDDGGNGLGFRVYGFRV